MGVTVGDIDALMSHTIRDGYRTEAHVDQQRYMTVTNIMHANPFDPGRTAAPIHFVIEIVLCDREDTILLLHSIEGLHVFLHFLTEEFGHPDRPNALLRLRCSDHVLLVEPLVGLADGHGTRFEVEVPGCQRQQLALANAAPVKHLEGIVGHRFIHDGFCEPLVFLLRPELHFLRFLAPNIPHLGCRIALQSVVPNRMVQDRHQLVMDTLEIGRRVGLLLFIPVGKKLVLPGDDVPGFDFAEHLFAKGGEELRPDHVFLT